MRKFLLSSVAALALVSTGALAASPGDATSNTTAPTTTVADQAEAHMLIGKEVVDANGKRIGTVDNILMDASGSKPEKVIIASGGFLGIGAKLIAVDFSQVTLRPAPTPPAAQGNEATDMVNQNGNPPPPASNVPATPPSNVAMVAGLMQDQVKNLPDFRYDPSMRTANQMTPPPASTETGSSGSSTPGAVGTAETNGTTGSQPGATASVERNTADLKQLIGKAVIDSNGDRVGTVDNVLMNATGDRPERAVIASGGFLGIGKKLIAVDFSQLKLGDNGRVHVSGLTREQVRGMKDFRYDPSMRTYLNSKS
jgi:sporulation protein YlmC with PRC-barrel domain